jgi:hypothetical protein
MGRQRNEKTEAPDAFPAFSGFYQELIQQQIFHALNKWMLLLSQLSHLMACTQP